MFRFRPVAEDLSGTKGVTLVELMLIIAIIGILSAVATPRFLSMVQKAKHAATRGNLGALRSALNIYYSDQEGSFPKMAGDAIGDFIPAFLENMPFVELGIEHNDGVSTYFRTNKVTSISGDDGKWYYDSITGMVNVNCTHADSRGNPISSW